jgi:hypothetical protein
VGIRKGSIVTLVAREQGGPGSSDSVITGVTVDDIKDGYLAVVDTSSQTKVYPWSSVRRLEVTTY